MCFLLFRFFFDSIDQKINIIKGPVRISELQKSSIYKNFSNNSFKESNYIFGHARLVTNGSQIDQENNQPIIKNGIIG